MSAVSEVARDYDVFISYAHRDAEHDVLNARLIAELLEGWGYEVWWDRELIAGENYVKALENKLERAKKVIVLWSPNARSSTYVAHECISAAAKDKLIPIIIEDCPVPQEWGAIHCLRSDGHNLTQDDVSRALSIKPSRKSLPVVPNYGDDRVRVSSLPSAVGRLIGRDIEQSRLRDAWQSTAPGADPATKTNVLVLHAIGGAGKTALMRRFIDGLSERDFEGAQKVYGWSAYSQGSGDNRVVDTDGFIADALRFFGYDLIARPIPDPVERGRKLASLVRSSRCLFVIDGLEPLQEAPIVNLGRIKDKSVAAFVTELGASNGGLLLITSRQPLPELAGLQAPRVVSIELNRLSVVEGVALLRELGAHGRHSELAAAVDEVKGHALSVALLGSWLDATYAGDIIAREHLRLAEIIDDKVDFGTDATARFARRASRILDKTSAGLQELNQNEKPFEAAETSVMAIVGLFDRPVEPGALAAIFAEPQIPGLTEWYFSLNPRQREARFKVALNRLRRLRLLNAAYASSPDELDAHPLIREHFGKRFKELSPNAYREANSRLCDYYRYQGLPEAFCNSEGHGLLSLCSALPQIRTSLEPLISDYVANGSWPEGWRYRLPSSLLRGERSRVAKLRLQIAQNAIFDAGSADKKLGPLDVALRHFQPETIDAMMPLIAAVAHGVAAGRTAEVFEEIYIARIRRGNEGFISRRLGASSANLGALASFFEELWSRPVADLNEDQQARVLSHAAFTLRAMGRLRDAAEVYEAALAADKRNQDWRSAAAGTGSLSELCLSFGWIDRAVKLARESVAFAVRSGDWVHRSASTISLALALHQAGQITETRALFVVAEHLQSEWQPTLPLLCQLSGFRYAELLLALGETSRVRERAEFALVEGHDSELPLECGLLTVLVARAMFAEERNSGGADFSLVLRLLNCGIERLRRSGQEDFLPVGLLARASVKRETQDLMGSDTDLKEAAEISDRGQMGLLQADVQLEYARLMLACAKIVAATDQSAYLSAADRHITAAERLIDSMGYKRRLPELLALKRSFDGKLDAALLGPDIDPEGKPAGMWLELNP